MPVAMGDPKLASDTIVDWQEHLQNSQSKTRFIRNGLGEYMCLVKRIRTPRILDELCRRRTFS